MSSATNPAPLPAPGPEVAPAHRPKISRKVKLFFFSGLMLFGAALLYVLTRTGGPQTPVVAAKVMPVDKGDVELRVRIVGVTTARNFAVITAPRLRGPEARDMNILKIVASGTFVKKGDVIAEVDPQAFKDHMDDTADGLRDRENDVKKKVVTHELNTENQRQSLRVAKAALDKAQWDMKAVEVRTVVDQELLKLAVEEAAARYKQISEEVPLLQQSQKADMRITNIAFSLEQQHLARHESDVKTFVIRAPMDGMAIVLSAPRSAGDQQLIREGDRLSPSQPFMKIVDTADMQVEGTVNQSESSLFRIGQAATVGLDAFPGARYAAKVDSIGALATGGRGQNFFIRQLPIRVRMSQVDSRVIPDLSASADILLNRAANAVNVPAAAVREENGKKFVYVKTREGFQKREIQVGLETGTRVVVLDGVKPGDEVRVD